MGPAMNQRIQKLAVDSGMMNYIDNETPRRYFLSGNADEEDLEKFAELIVRECEQVSLKNSHRGDDMGAIIARQIKEHFGVEE